LEERELEGAIRELLKSELSSISGLFCEYRGRLLASSSLSDVNVLLLSLHVGGYIEEQYDVSYELTKKLFVHLGRKAENFRKAVYNAKKKGYIEKRDERLRLLVKGVEELQRILGQLHKAPVIIIKSGEYFVAIKKFEEYLASEMQGEELLLCDPYLSPYTLFPFTVLKDKLRRIRILTSNVQDQEKFKNYKRRLRRELGIEVEVRVNKKLHDRYMIIDDRCWSIGASIKDLGNKDTIIKEVSEVCSSLRQLFEERWNEGALFDP